MVKLQESADRKLGQCRLQAEPRRMYIYTYFEVYIYAWSPFWHACLEIMVTAWLASLLRKVANRDRRRVQQRRTKPDLWFSMHIITSNSSRSHAVLSAGSLLLRPLPGLVPRPQIARPAVLCGAYYG